MNSTILVTGLTTMLFLYSDDIRLSMGGFAHLKTYITEIFNLQRGGHVGFESIGGFARD